MSEVDSALEMQAREALAAQYVALGVDIPPTVWTETFALSPKLRAIATAIDRASAPAPLADPKVLLERLWESFDPDDVPKLTRRKLREAMRKAGLLG